MCCLLGRAWPLPPHPAMQVTQGFGCRNSAEGIVKCPSPPPTPCRRFFAPSVQLGGLTLARGQTPLQKNMTLSPFAPMADLRRASAQNPGVLDAQRPRTLFFCCWRHGSDDGSWKWIQATLCNAGKLSSGAAKAPGGTPVGGDDVAAHWATAARGAPHRLQPGPV
eukprot:scaffold23651_cov114-Isochrysis_galbana.AAC.2